MRTAPSAGALYPLEVYAVIKKSGVEGIPQGVYHYEPGSHTVTLAKAGDFSSELAAACLGQEDVGEAAVAIVLTAVFGRTTTKYGQRGIQYVFQESGHVAQNICLQAIALGLGSVVKGAFSERDVEDVVGGRPDEKAIYVQAIGAPA
jgi:SagB-type dehydrogenase family enzyme